jgi:WD40 repeat protein
MKKIQSIIFVILFLISITIGCTSNSATNSIPVSPSPSNTAPPTETPIPPTATATFTPTPTPQSILPDNAEQIIILNQLSDAGNPYTLTFLPNGMSLVVNHKNQVQLLDLNTGEITHKFPIGNNDDEISSISVSSNGTYLAAGTVDGIIYVWDVETKEPVGEPFDANVSVLDSMAFSPDGTLLAFAGSNFVTDEENFVRFWNTKTQELVGNPLVGHESWVKQIVFSPDGKLLATRAGDIYLWDVATGQSYSQPQIKMRSGAGFMAFSPDGTMLITESIGNINFWDIKSGKAVGIPIDEKEVVFSVALSPDGKLIAVGLENIIHIWDTETRQLAAPPLTGHTHWVNGLVFSPNGWWLISAATVYTTEYFLWGLPR